MAQHVETRTIHTIYIDLQDDVLSAVQAGDTVEVRLIGRYGKPTAPKTLTARDLDSLIGDNHGKRLTY